MEMEDVKKNRWDGRCGEIKEEGEGDQLVISW